MRGSASRGARGAPMGSWQALTTSDHAAHGEAEDEQRNKAVDQERLPLAAPSYPRPRERQREDCRNSVQVVCCTWCPRTGQEHGRPSHHLHEDKYFANRQRSSEAARNRLTAEIGHDPPRPNSAHEQHHGQGEAIVHKGEEFQRFTALSMDREATLFVCHYTRFGPAATPPWGVAPRPGRSNES